MHYWTSLICVILSLKISGRPHATATLTDVTVTFSGLAESEAQFTQTLDLRLCSLDVTSAPDFKCDRNKKTEKLL